jgi:DNA-binding response OmpR family regulator
MGDSVLSTPRMTTRVLVVDDSPTIRKVVSAVLERHGFEAIEAVDGQAALEKLVHASRATHEGDEPDETEKIDVVLVDFVMPRMNGFQLCRAIRHDELLRDTPVVLMSAKSDRIREHFVQQTGAIDAITKPFEAQALVAVIENAIRRSTEWRQRERSDRHRIADPPEAIDPLRTVPTEGRPPIALQGDIAVIPIGAVLQLLQIESRTGLLLVTDGRSEVTMSVRRGLIDLVQARGAGREFRLGRYFIEHGLVTTEDIDRLLRDHPPSPARPPPESGSRSALPRGEASTGGRKLIGDLLVDSGRVTREQLRDGLARQSSELVYEVLRWPAGRFEFRLEGLPALAESAQLALPVASVVMEGFRRVDEWRVVEAGLGSFESVLQPDPVAIQGADLERLTKDERRLLEMIDGTRAVRAVIEQSHMSSFDACKVLYQLLEARLVRRRPA